jgi:putative membrane protein
MKVIQAKLLILSALLCSLSAFADESSPQMDPTQTQQQGAKTAKEKSNQSTQTNSSMIQKIQLLNHIHHINQKEIQLSKMALDKSKSQQIKDYAQHMIDDHQKADKKLEALAKNQNIELESFQPAGYEKATQAMLKELSGAQFDQAFVDLMKSGHKMAANELQLAQSEAKNPQIKSYIESILPTVREHQKMAANFEKKESQMAGETQSRSE